MLARRFGYAVSPAPAAIVTPSVLGQLDKAARMNRVLAMAVPILPGHTRTVRHRFDVAGVLLASAAL
ncbi:hypothetical protein AB0C69_29590, partial [Actinomadura sp. NPDC048032]|uniref:hypothetical protein n=1 Tax=Actinomadura sp. NPDC048032 TaxID=3155747 RepID=UPI0033F53CCE